MNFMLKIIQNCESGFQKRHNDVTSGRSSTHKFFENGVKNFFRGHSDNKEKSCVV